MVTLTNPPAEFVRNLLTGAESAPVADLAGEIEQLVAYPALTEDTPTTVDICRRWDGFCHRLLHAYQDLAVDEVYAGAIKY